MLHWNVLCDLPVTPPLLVDYCTYCTIHRILVFITTKQLKTLDLLIVTSLPLVPCHFASIIWLLFWIQIYAHVQGEDKSCSLLPLSVAAGTTEVAGVTANDARSCRAKVNLRKSRQLMLACPIFVIKTFSRSVRLGRSECLLL